MPIVKHLDSIKIDFLVVLLDFSSYFRLQNNNLATVYSDLISGIKIRKRGNDSINVNYLFC